MGTTKILLAVGYRDCQIAVVCEPIDNRSDVCISDCYLCDGNGPLGRYLTGTQPSCSDGGSQETKPIHRDELKRCKVRFPPILLKKSGLKML